VSYVTGHQVQMIFIRSAVLLLPKSV